MTRAQEQPQPHLPRFPILLDVFRPFFLLAGLQAAIQAPVWLAQLLSGLSLRLPYSASLWHGHEMIFGFGTAALAGFLLTAIPHFTKIILPTGRPLAALVLLWLAARLAFAMGGVLPPWIAAVLDLLFLPALAAFITIPLIQAQKMQRPLHLVLLALLTLANGLILAEMMGLAETGRNGLYLGLFLFVLMIGIVGGRIIPSLTESALQQNGVSRKPTQRPWLEKLSILSLLIIATSEGLAPGSAWAAALCLVAAPLHAIRLSGWGGWHSRRMPVVWVLHLSYFWLPVGLLLFGLASMEVVPLPTTGALHALTSGAMGCMTLSVMSRAALAHGGRPIVLSPLTVTAYLLIWSAAWLRIIGPMIDLETSLWLSSLAWSLGFALFVVVYAPICLTMVTENQEGLAPTLSNTAQTESVGLAASETV